MRVSISNFIIFFSSWCLFFFIFPARLTAQTPITFVVTSTPSYTPESDTLYLVTSLDNWNIADPKKKFKLYSDGYYRLTIDIGEAKKFEYKINRGNWDKVEGNNWGDFLANRRFTYNDSIYEVKLRIESWQDLHDREYPPVEIIIMSIPSNTPHDADIYMAGTFNNWMDNDPAYKLTPGADGTYRGEIQAGIDTIYFKFTRGTWASTEARWDGGMRSNRIYIANRAYKSQIVAEIRGWHDLSSGNVWIKVIFLVFFLQSIMVFSLLFRFMRIGVLISLSAMVSLAFLAKVFYANHNLFYLFPQLVFLPALIYPFAGSWMYTWFKSNILKEQVKISYIHFLPILPLIWYVQFAVLPSHALYLKIVNNELTNFFFFTYGYSLLLHLFFNYKLQQLISHQIAEIPDLIYRFYRSIQNNWYVSALLFIAGIVSIWQKLDIKFVIDWTENALWVGIGVVMVYFEWFFLSSLYTDFVKNKSRINKEQAGGDSWGRLKTRLTELMQEKGVYSNPNLTLTDLAGYLGTNNHYVSKLINEGFQKSYTDYVNAYRVEAFIRAIESNDGNKTFLSHAYKVGFNSKSAFNRAFKKVTNSTPSEYFTEKKSG